LKFFENFELEKSFFLFRSASTTRHVILEGRRALDRAFLPLVPYPKRPRAFFVSFLKLILKLSPTLQLFY
jgi:hypothetical protein